MKIYLASSWRNAYHADALASLIAAGHDVYDFKNPIPGNIGFSWKQISDRPLNTAEILRETLQHPIAIEGFGFDFHAMKWADACVLLLPCGNSAHLEAGWFGGQGKPVVVWAPEAREPELMYRMFCDGGPTPIVSTREEVLAALQPPALAPPRWYGEAAL